jgi:hypothetical protein
VIGNVPVTVGVPDSVPLLAKVRPVGNAPVSLQLNGVCPLVTSNVLLYGRLIVPLAAAGDVEIVGGGGGSMTIVTVALACSDGTDESVTVIAAA